MCATRYPHKFVSWAAPSAVRKLRPSVRAGLVAGILLAGLVNTDVLAQHCRNDIPRGGGPDAYQERDNDRCEGFTILNRSNEILNMALVSFVGQQDYDPQSFAPIQVSWPPLGGALSVSIHARSTDRRIKYRMDTLKPAGTPYTWPTSFLRTHKIPRDVIAVYAYAGVLPGSPGEVYLPVNLSQGRSPVASGTYCVRMLVPHPLESLAGTLESWNPDQRRWKEVMASWNVRDIRNATDCFSVEQLPSGFARVTYTPRYRGTSTGDPPTGAPLPVVFLHFRG